MSLSDERIKNHDSTLKKSTNIKKIDILKKHIRKLSYEEALSELDKILTNVQDENMPLDTIQENYIKGQLLLKHCEELLQIVEQEINEINPEFLNID